MIFFNCFYLQTLGENSRMAATEMSLLTLCTSRWYHTVQEQAHNIKKNL